MTGWLGVPRPRRTAWAPVIQYTARMTSPTSEIRAQPRAPFFTLSGTLLPFLLLALSLLVSPRFLEHHISLEWRLGNIRWPAYVLQALLVGAAAVSMLFRRRISARLATIFPSRRQLVLALVTGTMSVMLTLVVFEAACRLLDVPVRYRVPRAEDVTATFDGELGWAYIPNRSVVSSFGVPPRRILSHFDDIGARVRAPGVTHDPAAPTVLLVGDSLTMGHGVVFEESFAGRLEAMADFPYQVVNLGVQAFGTDQSLLMLMRYIKRFNTKVVVYTFIDDHVVRNATDDRRVLQVDANVVGTKPLFGVRPDGTLYLRKAPHRLSDHHSTPRLWELLQIAWNRLGPRPSIPLTRALVQEMRRVSEANGAAFLLVYWSGLWTRPGLDASIFDSMNLDILDTDADAPADWRHWTIPGDGHPDARAHARVAQLLYQRLMRGPGHPRAVTSADGSRGGRQSISWLFLRRDA